MYTLINVGSHTSSKYSQGVTSVSLDMILAALPVAWHTSLAGAALHNNDAFAPFQFCDADSRHGILMHGKSESTFILAFSRSLADLRIFGLEQLAHRLHQDCIAIAEFEDDGTFISGKLVGPHAEAWGNFNRAFFLDLMGKPI